MSVLGAALGRAAGALGGPQAATLVVVAGLVAGALGGGLVASGGGAPGQAGGELGIYACPESGEPLVRVASGQRFLITGKTADAAWLRIHYPLPGRTEAWIPASPVRALEALSNVPVATCAPELEAAVASPFRGPSIAPGQGNSPSPSPTPSAAPSGPRLASLTARPGTIAGGPERYCEDTARAVTFSVTAADPGSVGSVALFYREPGASAFASKPMTRSGAGGTWQVALDTDADGIAGSGPLRYYVSATDAGGSATSRLPASGTKTVTVDACANGGPTMASLKASPGTVYTNLAACQGRATSTAISVGATDVDDVAGLTLFYRLPGDGSYRSQPMARAGGRWSATVTPVDQRPNAHGKASYYVVAKDKLGASAKSATKTFTVDRCDFEAAFDGVFPTGPTYACTTGARITIGTYADDRDQPEHGLKVTFYWTLENPRTNPKPISGHMTASFSQGNYYQGTTATFNGQTFYAGRLTVYAITQDKYGGRTRSAASVTTGMACK